MKLLLLLPPIAWFSASCNLEKLNDPIIIPVLDQEFTFDLWENLAATNGTGLEIQISTTELEDCLNSQILTEQTRTDQALNLRVYDILDPEVCDPGQAPAQGGEMMHDLAPGTYHLNVDIQDVVVNSGNLIITPNYFRVEMDTQEGIRWVHEELRRVPANTLWGYITYETIDERTQALGIKNELAAMSGELPLVDGYYGYFEVLNNDTQLVVKDMPPFNVLPFKFRYTGGDEELSSWLENARASATGAIHIILMDAAGREW
ncbi:MAG: hypothetical protein R2795_13495 [Saprospiraceae bacterium]